MAGDWIKMRSGLPTHPKVVRIASALKADRLRVIGGLHAVWSLFDTHSDNGALIGYTTEALDDLIGWPGFSAEMVRVEWLVEEGETLAVPRFDDHNGQSAKRRAQEAERKRMARECAPSIPEMSAPNADKKRTREEKRREDIKSSSATATRLPADWQPDDACAEFCRVKRPDLHVDSVADNFRDYWIAQPGEKGRKTDWLATWRNWVRKETAGKVVKLVRSDGQPALPDFMRGAI